MLDADPTLTRADLARRLGISRPLLLKRFRA